MKHGHGTTFGKTLLPNDSKVCLIWSILSYIHHFAALVVLRWKHWAIPSISDKSFWNTKLDVIKRHCNTFLTAATTADGSAPSPTDPTAYYDAFWRYVQYYGEDAARKYYGAWSPPVGTPNPYAGQQVQQQPQDPSAAAKETGVRKMSNLPAWMNKS